MTADLLLTPEEVAEIDCVIRAGLTPTPETVARMMATILHLQRCREVQESPISSGTEDGRYSLMGREVL